MATPAATVQTSPEGLTNVHADNVGAAEVKLLAEALEHQPNLAAAISTVPSLNDVPIDLLNVCISHMPGDVLVQLCLMSKYLRQRIDEASIDGRFVGQEILLRHALTNRADGSVRLSPIIRSYMGTERIRHKIETGQMTVAKALKNISNCDYNDWARRDAYDLGIWAAEIQYNAFSAQHVTAINTAVRTARERVEQQIKDEAELEEKEIREAHGHGLSLGLQPTEGIEASANQESGTVQSGGDAPATPEPTGAGKYAAEIKAAKEVDKQRRIRQAISQAIDYTLSQIYELSEAKVRGFMLGISRLQLLSASNFSRTHADHLSKLKSEGKSPADIIKEFEVIGHLTELQLKAKLAGFEARDYMADWFSNEHIDLSNKGFDMNLLRGLKAHQLAMLTLVKSENHHLIAKSICSQSHKEAVRADIPFELIYDLEEHQVQAVHQLGYTREEVLKLTTQEVFVMRKGLPLKIVKMLSKELQDKIYHIQYEKLFLEIYEEAKALFEKQSKVVGLNGLGLGGLQNSPEPSAGTDLNEPKIQNDEHLAAQPEKESSPLTLNTAETGSVPVASTLAERRERKALEERLMHEAKHKAEQAIKEANRKRQQEYQESCIKIFERMIAEYRGLWPYQIKAMRQAGLKREQVMLASFTEESAEHAIALKKQGGDLSVIMQDLSALVTPEQTAAVLEFGVPIEDVIKKAPEYSHMQVLRMRKGYQYKDFSSFSYNQLQALLVGLDIVVVKILEKTLVYGIEVTNLVMIFRDLSLQITQQLQNKSGITDNDIKEAIEEASKSKASELVGLSGFQIKAIAAGLRHAQVTDYRFTAKHADILFGLKVQGAKKDEILKRFSEIQYLSEFQVKGLELGFTESQVKSHWFSEKHWASVEYGLNGNRKHTAHEVQGLNAIELELLDYMPDKRTVLEATLEAAYQDYHLPAIREGHPYDQIFVLNREQVTLVMEFAWEPKVAGETEVTNLELEGMRLGYSYEDVRGFVENHIEALKLGIPLPLVKKLKKELFLLSSNQQSSMFRDLEGIEPMQYSTFDIRGIVAEATAEVELRFLSNDEKERQEDIIQSALYAAFEQKIRLLSNLNFIEIQAIRLGLSTKQVQDSKVIAAHIHYLQKLKERGKPKKEISRQFEQIKYLNSSQVLALQFGIDIKRVREQQEFEGIRYWKTLKVKGFDSETILKLKGDQAFGIAEGNLTVEQVNHRNYCSALVEVMLKQNYIYEELIQLEPWQLDAMNIISDSSVGQYLKLTPTSPDWAWLTPEHFRALDWGLKPEEIRDRDASEVRKLFGSRGVVATPIVRTPVPVLMSDGAKSCSVADTTNSTGGIASAEAAASAAAGSKDPRECHDVSRSGEQRRVRTVFS